jgi:hypothetical protein
MRVIQGVEMEVHCPQCKSVLGVSPSDVTDCGCTGTHCSCPECDHWIRLSPGDMNSLFKSKVKWDE